MAWHIMERGNEYNIYSNYTEFLLDSEGDINDIPEDADYSPGSIAHTAGFNKMWEADANLQWVEIGGDI